MMNLPFSQAYYYFTFYIFVGIFLCILEVVIVV